MNSVRSDIIELVEQGAISTENLEQALLLTKLTPDGQSWKRFIDHLLLWLGALALAFSVLFFIAYNWSDLGRFAKFAMVEALMVLAIVAYLKFGAQALAGKISLLVATIFLGVMLALYGQTYQTGADPWQLFFNWALLMLPWALVSRFAAIWLVWVALLNLSVILYYQTFRGVFGFLFDSHTGLLWTLFVLNSIALISWEFLSRTCAWLLRSWAVRVLALAQAAPITGLVLYAIFGGTDLDLFSWPVWLLWVGALYFVYRRRKPDLFMLALCCLSGIIVTVTFLARHMLDDASSASFLFLALVVIGLGTGAAIWLKQVHREWQS